MLHLTNGKSLNSLHIWMKNMWRYLQVLLKSIKSEGKLKTIHNKVHLFDVVRRGVGLQSEGAKKEDCGAAGSAWACKLIHELKIDF